MQQMKLGEEGAVAVGKMLAANKSVTSINLSNNKLGDVGGAAVGLAGALKVNTALTSFNLGDNGLCASLLRST